MVEEKESSTIAAGLCRRWPQQLLPLRQVNPALDGDGTLLQVSSCRVSTLMMADLSDVIVRGVEVMVDGRATRAGTCICHEPVTLAIRSGGTADLISHASRARQAARLQRPG